MTPKTKIARHGSGAFQKKSRRGRNEVPADAASPPRIIGGDLKGRRLAFRPGGPTRPMKDRVREMTFDLLGTAVRGATVLDLFAGTGALGFEALSRGAQRAIFAERHFPTADCLRDSSRELGLVERVDIIPGDVLLWSRRMPPLSVDNPWIIFVSPPWNFFHTRVAEIKALLKALAAIAPNDSRMIVESDDQMPIESLPVRFGLNEREESWDTRTMSPAALHQKRL